MMMMMIIIIIIIITATSLQRGLPRWREVAAQKIWPVPEAVVTVLCKSDDGCGWHPKHVERTYRVINRLRCVASRWTIIDILNKDLNWTCFLETFKKNTAVIKIWIRILKVNFRISSELFALSNATFSFSRCFILSDTQLGPHINHILLQYNLTCLSFMKILVQNSSKFLGETVLLLR